MMTFFYKYKCSQETCTNKISDKTHEWCQRMGIKDYCYDHIPAETRVEAVNRRYSKAL